jgi:hypothetical protein
MEDRSQVVRAWADSTGAVRLAAAEGLQHGQGRGASPSKPSIRSPAVAAIPAGVNPVPGLYASFTGSIAGGLSSNTRLMLIRRHKPASAGGQQGRT